MRLNYDCIHDVLLAISELNRYTSRESHYELHTVTKQEIIEHPLVAGQYSYDDILYSIDQLFDMGFVEGYRIPPTHGELRMCGIDNIAPTGHEFLDDIKEPSVWEAVKAHAKKLGAISMTTLQMAIKYVLEHPECIEQAKNLIGCQ